MIHKFKVGDVVVTTQEFNSFHDVASDRIGSSTIVKLEGLDGGKPWYKTDKSSYWETHVRLVTKLDKVLK